MLNSESCESGRFGLESLAAGRLRRMARQFAEAHAGQAAPRDLESASRDFASLFYGLLVQQMRRTISQDDDEESAVFQGAWDFFNMFLPRAIARQTADPLAAYIRERLGPDQGDAPDGTP